MKNVSRILALCCGIGIVSTSLVWGDDPKVKSKKEQEAFMNMQKTLQSAPDAKTRLKAIDDFLDQFADTEFKPLLLENAMQFAQQSGDPALAETYAQRLLEVDPKSFEANLTLASITAQGAKEFDLDKSEKTAKVQKYADAVYADVKDKPKPMSQLSDQQWEDQKKGAVAQAHVAVGMMDMANKKYDDAINEFKTAYDTMPDPIAEFRLGEAYMKATKWDDASTAFDKVLSMPNTPPQVKQYAQQRKADVAKLKAAAGSK